MSEEDILGMSDEEALEQPLPDDVYDEEPEEEVEDTEEDSESQDDEDEGDYEEPEESSPYAAESEEQEQTSEDYEETDSSQETSQDLDYKAEYEKLLTPFKANGRQVKVDNVDEAIRLMQMGANYNKKMQALKPNLQVLKMLERHQLLDENKISYLIDLDKKNPKAIAKLIKDAEIDPMDLDTSEDTDEYRPSQYKVSEVEMQLDNILDELESSPHFNRVLSIATKQWDDESKNVIAQNPALLKVIHEHLDSGIYDQVMDAVEKERTLGGLQGLNDIAAYKQVGDVLHSKGLLKAQSPASQKPTATVQDAKAQREAKRQNRKRAAQPTKSRSTSNASSTLNPLAMSDEEFENFAPLKYM